MTPTIILISVLLTSPSTSQDLCTEVLVDAAGDPISDSAGATLSRHCKWTGPRAPLLDAEVCCESDDSGTTCVEPNADGGCDLGSPAYCEYGESNAGGVVCYQRFPSACEHQSCGSGEIAANVSVADILCCEDGDCWEFDPWTQYSSECLGSFSYCMNGYLNGDGTVDCYD